MLNHQVIKRSTISISPSDYPTVTIEYYKRCLTRLSKFLVNPELNSITTNQIKQFFTLLKSSSLSRSSVKVDWKVIHSFYMSL